MGMMPFFYDPTFLMLLPALAFALWTQWKVKSTFQRYSREPSQAGYTGAQVARQILNDSGLREVNVDAVAGKLSDHYDPSSKVVNLSESNYAQRSIASLAVAAHEVGHALQDQDGYQPMIWRAKLVPAANIGSFAAFPMFFIGMFIGPGMGMFLMDLGIALFAAALMFHLVTLPVEFNASSRAIVLLQGQGFLSQSEIPAARAVLRAAALTYVASATMALVNLLRLLILRNMSND
jgi:uncharacterized protein